MTSFKRAVGQWMRRKLGVTGLVDLVNDLREQVRTLDERIGAIEQRAQAESEELQTQVRTQKERIGVIEQRHSQDLQDVATRIGALERLLGIGPPGTPEDQNACAEHLLELRLGQVESRIVAHLEGPYFDRVLEAVREEARTP